MFGTVPMQVQNQQENIPPNSSFNANDRTTNENPEETTPMETVQFQLPSTENIAQHRHRYFHESSSNSIRTGWISRLLFLLEIVHFLRSSIAMFNGTK
jgi:hypothetical protein